MSIPCVHAPLASFVRGRVSPAARIKSSAGLFFRSHLCTPCPSFTLVLRTPLIHSFSNPNRQVTVYSLFNPPQSLAAAAMDYSNTHSASQTPVRTGSPDIDAISAGDNSVSHGSVGPMSGLRNPFMSPLLVPSRIIDAWIVVRNRYQAGSTLSTILSFSKNQERRDRAALVEQERPKGEVGLHYTPHRTVRGPRARWISSLGRIEVCCEPRILPDP